MSSPPWPNSDTPPASSRPFPKNEIGSAAIRALRLVGVDTGFIVRKGKRLGIYFAERGANQKPTQVIYDRDHSGIAEAAAGRHRLGSKPGRDGLAPRDGHHAGRQPRPRPI